MTTSPQTAIHAWVSGRVQGVYFRASTREKALALGLAGWVRNLPDGRVELVAMGSENAVSALQAWLHCGPSLARVDAVSCHNIEPDPALRGFEQRPTPRL